MLLLSMAFADLLMGITVTLDVSLCLSKVPISKSIKIALTMGIVGFQTCSVVHIIALTIERYFSIECPFKYKKVRSNRLILVVIILVWLTSIGGTMPCLVAKKYALIGFSTFIIAASALMMVVYRYLFIAIHNTMKLQKQCVPSNDRTLRSRIQQQERKSTLNVFIFVVVFAVCNLPQSINLLFEICTKQKIKSYKSGSLRTLILFWCVCINSLINPMLYIFLVSGKSYLRQMSRRVTKRLHKGAQSDSAISKSTNLSSLSYGSSVAESGAGTMGHYKSVDEQL